MTQKHSRPVTTTAAARALMLQDVADGRIERPNNGYQNRSKNGHS